LWPALRDTTWLADVTEHEAAVAYWTNVFDRANDRGGNVSYWDHQWTFACWAHSGLSIMPRANLVSNAGCGPDGTHTLNESDPTGNLPATEMIFPLVHPPNVLRRPDADRELLREIILPRLIGPPPSLLRRVATRVAPPLVKRGYRKLADAGARLVGDVRGGG
jgi:hypothetical protein